MNPVFSISLMIPLALLVMLAVVWMGWRSSGAVSPRLRKILLTLRVLAVLMLLVFLLNPGEWRAVKDQLRKVWVVMVDKSASMSVEESKGEKKLLRIEQAKSLMQKIGEQASNAGVDVRYYDYDASSQQIDLETEILADGEVSNLTASAEDLLTQFSSQGEALSGVFVLSDGRQTQEPRHSNFELRAQAMNVPFYAVPIGGKQERKDVMLKLPRKTITAFAGQQVQLTAVLLAEGLGDLETEISLMTEDGKLLDSAKVKLKDGERFVKNFFIKAPEKSASYRVHVPQQKGELRSSNNESEVHLQILTDKARVFIAEGSPYWDSKFLAQLLRQQKHMDVVSVNRLSDSRWFRVGSGESKPHESEVDVFPDTKEELAQYDLIIFGKNSEHFLTPERIAHLRTFVKDQGGAVLFSRSKPYTGLMPDLAPLEPVTWKTGMSGHFRMIPSVDGQSVGLFGQALPAANSSVWKSLPELKDAHQIDVLKPFTRVLAYGELGNATTQGRFPMLMVRRYGQGVSGLVNADGLWKWDFYPEARELGNMYHEFWIQMIHWMLAYAEFLPGQDYSLNASASVVQPGTPVAFQMSYRGIGYPKGIQLEISSSQLEKPLHLVPAEVPSDDGRLRWGGSFTPKQAGSYYIKLISNEEVKKEASMPELTITVDAPPSEMDELSVDIQYLKNFSVGTGGRLVNSDELSDFLKNKLKPADLEQREHGVEWHSYWMHWLSPILLVIFLSLEWWLRRRNGLA